MGREGKERKRKGLAQHIREGEGGSGGVWERKELEKREGKE